MKFIKSSVEIVDQGSTVIDGFKHLEKAARNCYKSEDKIDENSWERMLNILREREHYSPLEHFTVYLTLDKSSMESSKFYTTVSKYSINPYSHSAIVTKDDVVMGYVTTNFRVIVENEWDDDLNFMTPPSEFHQRRITVKVNCSIGVSREWNRHRTMSISEQSTRYCNYSKDKFGSEITYIIPQWVYKLRDQWSDCVDSLDGSSLDFMKELDGDKMLSALSCHDRAVCAWMDNLENTERDYMYLIHEHEFKPQEARSILTLDTATCVYYTAFVDDWKKFFNLRCSSAAHPDIRILAEDLRKQFIERKLINE